MTRNPKSCHSSGQSQLIHMILLNTLLLSHLLFCSLLRFLRPADINLLRTLCRQTEQLHTVIDHLHKPTAHSQNMLCAISFLETHFSRNDSSNNILMLCQKGLLTVNSRDCQGFGTSCKRQLITGINLKTKCICHKIRSLFLTHLSLCFLDDILNCTNIEESIFRILIHLTINDCLESTDGFFQRNIFTLDTCEVLSYMEWLGKELLDLSCTEYSTLILFRKLFHTKNSDDVLKFFIFLKDFLYFTCYFIMFFTYNIRLQNTGSGFQRVNGRINTLLYDLSGKNGCCIQMSKCSCRSRVSQVIGRYIDSLYRCYRTILSRSDTFLKFTHLSSQCWLITYG